MEIKSNRTYSYPIKGKHYKGYKTDDYKVFIDSEVDGFEYSLKMVTELKDPELKSLIKQNKASVAYHLECPATAFRKLIYAEDQIGFNDRSELSFKIDKQKICGSLQICSFILATKDIENYTNSDFDDVYKNRVYMINKGLPLAIGEQFTFNYKRNTSDDSNKASIFSVSKDHKNSFFSLNMDVYNDRILILLPKGVYEQFQEKNQSENYRDLLNSLIVIPALIKVFEDIRAGDVGTEKEWLNTIARSLSSVYKENVCNEDLDMQLEHIKVFFDKHDTVQVAQELIACPINNAFNCLFQENNDED